MALGKDNFDSGSGLSVLFTIDTGTGRAKRALNANTGSEDFPSPGKRPLA